MLLGRQQQRRLTEAILADDAVNLAVVFGPLDDARRSEFEINLLLDLEHEDLHSIARWRRQLVERLQFPLRVWPLSTARPAAILMRQVLERGQVLKDYLGQWERLTDERDLIVWEAEQHQAWEERWQRLVASVVGPDDNVRLVIAIDPIQGDSRFEGDLGLVLGCREESKAAITAVHQRLLNSEFRFKLLRLSEVKRADSALAHLARTGRPLKDLDQQWPQLLEQGQRLIERRREARAVARLAHRWYGGGQGGVASPN